jgi:mannose-6-phosphate isomerase-like protein (cupin superfamily)
LTYAASFGSLISMTTRRDILGALSMLLSGVAAEGADNTGQSPDAVFTLANATKTEAAFGVTSVYFEGRTNQLKALTVGSLLLRPGQEPHPPHQHPEEEIIVIGEGSAEILVKGKTSHVGAGAVMYCEGNHLHGIKNTGSTPLRFYFFKWQA